MTLTTRNTTATTYISLKITVTALTCRLFTRSALFILVTLLILRILILLLTWLCICILFRLFVITYSYFCACWGLLWSRFTIIVIFLILIIRLLSIFSFRVFILVVWYVMFDIIFWPIKITWKLNKQLSCINLRFILVNCWWSVYFLVIYITYCSSWNINLRWYCCRTWFTWCTLWAIIIWLSAFWIFLIFKNKRQNN